jgi:hypothetical protein
LWRALARMGLGGLPGGRTVGSRRLGPRQSSPEPGAAVLQSPLLWCASWGVLGAAGWPWGHVAGKRRRETQSVGLLGPKQPSSPVAPLARRRSTRPAPLSAECFVPRRRGDTRQIMAPSWSRMPPPGIPMIPWMVLALAHLRRQGREPAHSTRALLLAGDFLPSVVLCRLVQPLAGNLALVAPRTPQSLNLARPNYQKASPACPMERKVPLSPQAAQAGLVPSPAPPESDLSIDFVSSGPALLAFFAIGNSPSPCTVHQNP